MSQFEHHNRGRLVQRSVIGILVVLALGGAVFWLSNRPQFVATDTRLRKPSCKSRLSIIGLSLKDYYDEWGRFPPPYVAGPDGRAMHSWRVLLLPYFGPRGYEVFESYDFGEPWDGPHNRKLAGQFGEIYRCPDAPGHGKPTETNYVAVVGDHTMWPRTGSVSIADVTDGASNTILLVEVLNSGIDWMEPRDLSFDELNFRIDGPGQKEISSAHDACARALLVDGHARMLCDELPAETVRSLILRDDGMPQDGEF